MLKTYLLLSLFLILGVSLPVVYAEENIDIKIKTHQTTSGKQVVKINNNQFTIEGRIDSFSNAQIVISDQEIKIDRSKFSISQDGELQVGKQAEVKGVIESSVLYAQEIKVLENASASSTTSPEPTDSPEPEERTEIRDTGYDIQDGRSDVEVEVNVKGPLSQVMDLLQKIFDLIQNIV